MKTKKHFGSIIAVLFIAATLMSCAARPAGSLFRGPHPSFSNVNVSSAKTGKASSMVVFGIGLITYPTITEAAKNGGITKIATVEYYYRHVWFIVEYTTIVTGE